MFPFNCTILIVWELRILIVAVFCRGAEGFSFSTAQRHQDLLIFMMPEMKNMRWSWIAVGQEHASVLLYTSAVVFSLYGQKLLLEPSSLKN